jgi:hypothetical protein
MLLVFNHRVKVKLTECQVKSGPWMLAVTALLLIKGPAYDPRRSTEDLPTFDVAVNQNWIRTAFMLLQSCGHILEHGMMDGLPLGIAARDN